MARQIQIRHGTAAAWTAANPILMIGEMGDEVDTGKWKVGNGVDNWNTLPYSSGPAGRYRSPRDDWSNGSHRCAGPRWGRRRYWSCRTTGSNWFSGYNRSNGRVRTNGTVRPDRGDRTARHDGTNRSNRCYWNTRGS